MSRRDRLGWLLFLISAVLFTAAGVRARDPLVIAGSVVFGVACLLFLTPATPGLVRGRRERRVD